MHRPASRNCCSPARGPHTTAFGTKTALTMSTIVLRNPFFMDTKKFRSIPIKKTQTGTECSSTNLLTQLN